MGKNEIKLFTKKDNEAILKRAKKLVERVYGLSLSNEDIIHFALDHYETRLLIDLAEKTLRKYDNV